MNLSERQHQFAKDLEVGQAVVQQGGGNAVPVQFPEVDIEKSVTDAELKDLQQDTWNELQETTSVTADQAQQSETGEESADSADTGLSDRARALLDDVVAHPDRKLTKHYNALGMSRYSGNKAKKELVRRGLVEPYRIRKKYGQPTVLGLTDDGRSYLKQRGVTVEYTGRGGPRHRYWQQFLHDVFCEAGFDAVIEADDADIAADTDSGRVAVEVAMTAANREVEHVEDRLAGSFDRVVVGCRNERVCADLLRKLQAEGLADDRRVTVLLLRRLQSDFDDLL